jgi:cytochrome c peroxidase
MSEAKVTLGGLLFADTRLSVTGDYSCASCHRPALAFTDGRATAVGATGQRHRRNTPSLLNVAYNASFGWADPTTTTLEAQHRIPMFNADPVELGTDAARMLDALRADESFMARARAAFGTVPLDLDRVIDALASYVRSLIVADSPFDRHLYYDEELNPAARQGLQLFFSERLGCSQCHASFNLSGPVRTAAMPDVELVFHNTGLTARTLDRGLGMHTGRPEDDGAFRAPSLRNVARTAPYMHDGSLPTLQAVVAFYASGGRDHPNKRAELRSFTLSDSETDALIAFLESLSSPASVGLRETH